HRRWGNGRAGLSLGPDGGERGGRLPHRDRLPPSVVRSRHRDRPVTRVAFVTGVASGIGWAVAERLRDDGVAVVGLDLRAEAPDEVDVLAGDVTDRSAVEAAIAHAVERHGRLDIVANVAGIPQFGRVDDLGDAEW